MDPTNHKKSEKCVTLMSIAVCLIFGWANQQPVAAQTPVRKCDNTSVDQKGCPDLAKIENVCTFVSNGYLDPNPLRPRYKYYYQRKILEASRVEPGDTEEIIQKKVSAMWPYFGEAATCTSDIQNGSLLKYGITRASVSKQFIYDVLQWRVPLNAIDPSDGKTLLDYLRNLTVSNKETVLGPIFQGYYDRLRKAGARHKSELK